MNDARNQKIELFESSKIPSFSPFSFFDSHFYVHRNLNFCRNRISKFPKCSLVTDARYKWFLLFFCGRKEGKRASFFHIFYSYFVSRILRKSGETPGTVCEGRIGDRRRKIEYESFVSF